MPSQMEPSIAPSQPLTHGYTSFTHIASSLGTKGGKEHLSSSTGAKLDSIKVEGNVGVGASKSSAISIPKSSNKEDDEEEDEDEDGHNVASGSVTGSGAVGSSVSLLTKSLQIFSESSPSVGVEFFRGHLTPANNNSSGFSFDTGRRQSVPSIHQQLQQQQQQQDQEKQSQLQAQAQAQAQMATFMAPPLTATTTTSNEDYLSSSIPAYHSQQSQDHTYELDPSQHGIFADNDDQWQGEMRNQPGSGFPRRVRKTSFDHTVAKEGLDEFRGRGRHQVNGRPMAPPDEMNLVRIFI